MSEFFSMMGFNKTAAEYLKNNNDTNDTTDYSDVDYTGITELGGNGELYEIGGNGEMGGNGGNGGNGSEASIFDDVKNDIENVLYTWQEENTNSWDS